MLMNFWQDGRLSWDISSSLYSCADMHKVVLSHISQHLNRIDVGKRRYTDKCRMDM